MDLIGRRDGVGTNRAVPTCPKPKPPVRGGSPASAQFLGFRGRKVAEPVVKPGSVWDSHSSSPSVTAGIKRPTRVRHEPCHSTPIWSCSGWGLPCPEALSPRAVGSYPTVSPLPRTLAGRSAVYFLLHFPSAHAAQALPGTLLYGARTFLGALLRRDCLDRLRRAELSHRQDLMKRSYTLGDLASRPAMTQQASTSSYFLFTCSPLVDWLPANTHPTTHRPHKAPSSARR